ncbi:MAG: LCP family protein [Propionibacteriaceae bacterium]|jgi:LCP family protein required for cell wall assembly|nr:LCP family protein [Propionibacteriaceae bacterium]
MTDEMDEPYVARRAMSPEPADRDETAPARRAHEAPIDATPAEPAQTDSLADSPQVALSQAGARPESAAAPLTPPEFAPVPSASGSVSLADSSADAPQAGSTGGSLGEAAATAIPMEPAPASAGEVAPAATAIPAEPAPLLDAVSLLARPTRPVAASQLGDAAGTAAPVTPADLANSPATPANLADSPLVARPAGLADSTNAMSASPSAPAAPIFSDSTGAPVVELPPTGDSSLSPSSPLASLLGDDAAAFAPDSQAAAVDGLAGESAADAGFAATPLLAALMGVAPDAGEANANAVPPPGDTALSATSGVGMRKADSSSPVGAAPSAEADHVLSDPSFDMSIFVADGDSMARSQASPPAELLAENVGSLATAAGAKAGAEARAAVGEYHPRGWSLRRGAPRSAETGVPSTADASASGDASPAEGGGESTAAEAGGQPSGHNGMGKALGWTLLGAIIPGVGLIKGGRKALGVTVLAVFAALLAGLLALVIGNRDQAIVYLMQPEILYGLAAVLVLLGLIWVVVIGTSHLALRPTTMTTGQRAVGSVVVGLLSMVVLAPMALGANVAVTHANLVQTLFGNKGRSVTVPTVTNEVDPFADTPRLNVLIMGADSGYGRSTSLGLRPDSNIVASIDTKTGATTLFSLPRQTARMPFPEDSPLHDYYPYGFYDGSNPKNPEYMLNAMYNNIPARVPDDILGATDHLPEDIMKISVGYALGLDIDYYVLINLDGFKEFINALGGITVNVNYRIPIGGDKSKGIVPKEWIEPGPNQHLGGRKALWYARGRYSLDDYSRLERQRCVINAVVQQANPANVLARYQAIANVGENSISTDIPAKILPALVKLAAKVQGTKLRSIVFTDDVDGFSTTDPDWDLVRQQVQKAIKETEKTKGESASATASASASSATETPGVSASPTASGTATASPSAEAIQSDDLDDACAYHPEAYQRKK